MTSKYEMTIFNKYATDILNNKHINKLEEFSHHGKVTRLEHSMAVAYECFRLVKALKLKVDMKSMIRGALLHDFFLYDLKKERINNHFLTHPLVAFNNASNEFELNKIEKDIILKHMWPLTVAFPRYKESYIVSFVDKYSTLKESFDYFYKLPKLQRIYRYSYIFLSMLIFRII